MVINDVEYTVPDGEKEHYDCVELKVCSEIKWIPGSYDYEASWFWGSYAGADNGIGDLGKVNCPSTACLHHAPSVNKITIDEDHNLRINGLKTTPDLEFGMGRGYYSFQNEANADVSLTRSDVGSCPAATELLDALAANEQAQMIMQYFLLFTFGSIGEIHGYYPENEEDVSSLFDGYGEAEFKGVVDELFAKKKFEAKEKIAEIDEEIATMEPLAEAFNFYYPMTIGKSLKELNILDLACIVADATNVLEEGDDDDNSRRLRRLRQATDTTTEVHVGDDTEDTEAMTDYFLMVLDILKNVFNNENISIDILESGEDILSALVPQFKKFLRCGCCAAPTVNDGLSVYHPTCSRHFKVGTEFPMETFNDKKIPAFSLNHTGIKNTWGYNWDFETALKAFQEQFSSDLDARRKLQSKTGRAFTAKAGSVLGPRLLSYVKKVAASSRAVSLAPTSKPRTFDPLPQEKMHEFVTDEVTSMNVEYAFGEAFMRCADGKCSDVPVHFSDSCTIDAELVETNRPVDFEKETVVCLPEGEDVRVLIEDDLKVKLSFGEDDVDPNAVFAVGVGGYTFSTESDKLPRVEQVSVGYCPALYDLTEFISLEPALDASIQFFLMNMFGSVSSIHGEYPYSYIFEEKEFPGASAFDGYNEADAFNEDQYSPTELEKLFSDLFEEAEKEGNMSPFDQFDTWLNETGKLRQEFNIADLFCNDLTELFGDLTLPPETEAEFKRLSNEFSQCGCCGTTVEITSVGELTFLKEECRRHLPVVMELDDKTPKFGLGVSKTTWNYTWGHEAMVGFMEKVLDANPGAPIEEVYMAAKIDTMVDSLRTIFPDLNLFALPIDARRHLLKDTSARRSRGAKPPKRKKTIQLMKLMDRPSPRRLRSRLTKMFSRRLQFKGKKAISKRTVSNPYLWINTTVAPVIGQPILAGSPYMLRLKQSVKEIEITCDLCMTPATVQFRGECGNGGARNSTLSTVTLTSVAQINQDNADIIEKVERLKQAIDELQKDLESDEALFVTRLDVSYSVVGSIEIETNNKNPLILEAIVKGLLQGAEMISSREETPKVILSFSKVVPDAEEAKNFTNKLKILGETEVSSVLNNLGLQASVTTPIGDAITEGILQGEFRVLDDEGTVTESQKLASALSNSILEESKSFEGFALKCVSTQLQSKFLPDKQPPVLSGPACTTPSQKVSLILGGISKDDFEERESMEAFMVVMASVIQTTPDHVLDVIAEETSSDLSVSFRVVSVSDEVARAFSTTIENLQKEVIQAALRNSYGDFNSIYVSSVSYYAVMYPSAAILTNTDDAGTSATTESPAGPPPPPGTSATTEPPTTTEPPAMPPPSLGVGDELPTAPAPKSKPASGAWVYALASSLGGVTLLASVVVVTVGVSKTVRRHNNLRHKTYRDARMDMTRPMLGAHEMRQRTHGHGYDMHV